MTAQQTIAIIDYGMGNLHSAHKAVCKVAPEAKVIVTSVASEIEQADRVILPGVGAMRDCMAAINERHLVPVIHHAWQNKPFLGICVGMQALLSLSEENNGIECLDLFKGSVKALTPDQSLQIKVPHMGWNQVKQQQDHALWHNIKDQARFYFVHSYKVEPENNAIVYGSCEHGSAFAAAIGRDNVFAVQFHPEKSQKTGLQLLENFTQWQP